MKALILDGSRDGDSLTPVAVLGMTSALAKRADDVERVNLRELAVGPCAGCFGCWTLGSPSWPVKFITSCGTGDTRRRSVSERCHRPTSRPSGGGVMNVLILIGSPKGRKSASCMLGSRLAEGLRKHGAAVSEEMVHLSRACSS